MAQRKLEVVIAGDASGYERAAGKVSGVTGKLGGVFESVGKVAAGVFGGELLVEGFHKVTEAIGESLSAGRDALRQDRLTVAALKSTGGTAGITAGGIDKLAAKYALVSGVSTELVHTSENLLLRFTNIHDVAGKGNQIFDRTEQAILDVSAATGKKLTPVTIALGKALNDPIKGMGGLAKVGIQFTDQQKDQIKTLVGSGHALEAQKLVLESIQKRFGGAAAAAADPISRLHVLFQNIEIGVGKVLVPRLNQAINFLIGKAIPAIEVFVQAFKDGFSGKAFNAAGILGIAQKIGGVIQGLVRVVSGNTKGGGAIIGKALGLTPAQTKSLITVLQRIRQVTVTVVDFVAKHWKVAAEVVGLAIAALVAGPFLTLTVALAAIYLKFKVVRDAASAVVSFFRNTVQPAFAAFAAYVSLQFSHLSAYIQKNWAQISEAARHVFKALKIVVAVGLAPIVIAWRLFHTEILSVLNAAWTLIRSTIANALAAIRAVIQIVLALINGDWGKAWDGVKNLVSAALRQIGADISFGLSVVTNILKAGWTVALAVVKFLWGQMTSFIGNAVDGIKGAISGMWDGLWDGFVAVANTVLNGFSGLLNGIIDLINLAIKAYNAIPIVGDIPRIPNFSPPQLGQSGTSGPSSGGGFHQPGTQLAGGGIVRRRPGGVNATIGEGRYDEAVIPLPRDWQSMRANNARPTVITYNFNIELGHGTNPIEAGRAVANVLKKYEDANGPLNLRIRANAGRGAP